MQTLPPTPPMTSPTWNPEAGYQHLAHESVLPIFTRLAEGHPDADALLSAAFSPLVHAVLERCLDAGALGLFGFLRELAQPVDSHTVTRFVDPGTAWTFLERLPQGQVAAAFDLRPGGGPELELFPYVPLLDSRGQMPVFHRELLPLVLDVLYGWGATILVLHRPVFDPAQRSTVIAQAEAQWATLTQKSGCMAHADMLGQKYRFVQHTTRGGTNG